MVAGAVTYAATYTGNFDVGKFFLYAAVGFVSGAIGAAAGYGAGVLATTALVAAGMTTTTSIASGVIVGASTGLVEGAVAGGLNQIGTNLIEQRNAFEGVGRAIGMGAGIGALTGAAAGGITGKLNQRVATRLEGPPTNAAGPNISGTGDYLMMRGVDVSQDYLDDIDLAFNAAGTDDMTAIVGHGSRRGTNISSGGRRYVTTVSAAEVIHAGQNYQGFGIDMSMVCWAGRNGFAQEVASGIGVPVRASTGPTISNFYRRGHVRLFAGDRMVTIYPNRLQTAWVTLFGY